MSSTRSSKTKNIATMFIFVAFVLFLLALGIFWLTETRSNKTTDIKASSVDVLDCVSDQQIESFLGTALADQVEHKVKITFSNEKPYEITYSLSAIYADEQSLEEEGRNWVTDYGLYMGEHHFDSDYIDNVFSFVDKKSLANFYTVFSNVNAITAKIFFLNEGNYLAVRNYDFEKMTRYYEELGFNCEKK